MPDVVIAEFMEEGAVASLSERYDTLYDPGLVADPEALAGRLAGALALIVRNRTQVNDKLLAAADALRVVGRLGVGLDNIALDACRARGIAVIPASGANDDAVAEYVIAGALLLRRGACFATEEVSAGHWPRNRLMGREVLGATMGFVGFGSIARATARRAGALGMTDDRARSRLLRTTIRDGRSAMSCRDRFEALLRRIGRGQPSRAAQRRHAQPHRCRGARPHEAGCHPDQQPLAAAWSTSRRWPML
jgi:hypothetical protein